MSSHASRAARRTPHAAARFGITRPDYPPFGNIFKYKLLTASYVGCVQLVCAACNDPLLVKPGSKCLFILLRDVFQQRQVWNHLQSQNISFTPVSSGAAHSSCKLEVRLYSRVLQLISDRPRRDGLLTSTSRDYKAASLVL